MRVIQIVSTFPPYKGGMGAVAEKYAFFAKQGKFKSQVITPKYKNNSEANSDFFVLKQIKPILKYGNAALLLNVGKNIRGNDIVHLHYPFFGTDLIIWFLKAVLKRKFKLIIHYHMDVTGLKWYLRGFTWPSKMIFKSLVKNAQVITCGSLDYIKHSQIKNIYKKYQHKFKEINFGVDLDVFKPEEKKENNKNLQFLFVGGLDKAHYFKGLDFLFKTLAKFKNYGWTLKIVGSGNLMQVYKKQVIDFGLEKKIDFLGNVSSKDLPKIYRESDLFILPSINRNEAFGLVLLEAMASGVAILASDLPGVRTVFKHKKEGLYFHTNDQADLESKIEWCLQNTEELKKQGFKGRDLTEKKYNWDNISKKLNNLYEDLFNK